ncbi:MAG TPA: hypothetical protein V6C86_06005 [Oculatellaceae cyanobacterium]
MISLVVDHDSIKSISLPDGWREFEVPQQGFELSTLREFRPADSINDDVSLSLYNRGLALDDETAQDFFSLLTAPPHVLTSDELDQVHLVLNDANDPERFSFAEAKTEFLNGRPAMIVEGRWLRSQTDMLRIYIDIKGDGRFVQEVSFSAPIADYKRWISDVRACLQTLSWKT